MNYFNFILFLLVNAKLLLAYTCLDHKTCNDCLRDPAMCDWCASEDENFDTEPRCRLKGSYKPDWCTGSLYIPEDEIRNATLNRPLSDVVQIKPQEYKVKLRVGQPVDFKFSFQGAKNYPVDIYMLLDASHTMKDLETAIANSSEHIYNTMSKMTNKVNFGIGSYIDKNILPFVKVTNKHVYSFKNQLNLTSDHTAVKRMIDNLEFLDNFDAPEGGFDALAQALACDVGWREKSRKLLVFFTDSTHHTVGDGRSAGIFEPYDGKCYTNSAGAYTNELIMDYPSVPMINRLASDKEVTIIFTFKAAQSKSDKNLTSFYTDLKNQIVGSKLAMLKDQDIALKLKESYKEISTNVVLKVKVKSGNKNKFDIKFNPNCIKSDEILTNCKVEPEQRLDFDGTITLSEYYGQDTDVIDISVQGVNETLRLDVEVIKCTCEEEPNAPYCNNQMRQCGACYCNDNMFGNRCKCKKDKTEGDKTTTNDKLCIDPGQTKANPGKEIICSGHGVCSCELCECQSGYFGKFCECARQHCPGYEVINNNSSVCGGHGTCNCGEVPIYGRNEVCSCNNGWTHKPGAELLGCTCRNATESCITNVLNNTICNNRGKCPCNICECNPIAAWDKRVKQDSMCLVKPCRDCHSSQCTTTRRCVSCRINSDKCTEECDGIVVDKTYNELPKEYTTNNEWRLCSHQKTNLGCFTNFAYKYDDKEYRILLRMEEKLNCTQNYYMYGGFLLISLLVIGVLTLLAWKCLTNYRDRKEYEDFETKHKKLLNEPCDNPLYDAPTTTFRNPAFKRSING